VVLCEQAAAVGVDVRGTAPATRETDLLRPGSLVGRAHAILLTGGSAFGLDAAAGVMRYLEEHNVGIPTSTTSVPIVAAAALLDLALGRADVRPDAGAGYVACQAATDGVVVEGTVGAGTGATVAKRMGMAAAVKGGIGTAARMLEGGTIVAALVAVNALGNVYDPWTGQVVAQPRRASPGPRTPPIGANTTIGVIATNARLDSVTVNRLATLGHDGLAMAIRPAHTLYDGDTLFAVSLPGDAEHSVDFVTIGEAAALVVAEAVLRGVRSATPLHGVPSLSQ
jgi:L-aminopeptidase/D-esterase-like protein